MKKYMPLMVIVILTTGLLLKSVRYLGAVPTEHDFSTEQKLSDFMTHHDWSVQSYSGTEEHSLLRSLTFIKFGCKQTITVAILSDNTELRKFVKNLLGDNLAIFQDNRFSNNQRPLQLGLEPAKIATLKIFGKRGHDHLPPLAISPAPSPKATPCAPPAKKHWKSWFGENNPPSVKMSSNTIGARIMNSFAK